MGLIDFISRGPPERCFTIDTTESVAAVPHWTEYMAIREFVQNAMDEMQVLVKDVFDYIPKYPEPGKDFGLEYMAKKLYVWDKGRGVRISNIIIRGFSKKRYEMNVSRGEYGEGIKVAIAVLLKKGRRIKIYTRDKTITPMVVNKNIYGDIIPVISYRVCEYKPIESEYGTVIEISTNKVYSIYDFVVDIHGKNMVPASNARFYIIPPDIAAKIPDDVKMRIEMRGNETPYLFMITEKLGVLTKEDIERLKRDAIPIEAVNFIINDEGGKIYYRGMNITPHDFKSLFSYDIWEPIPPKAMGRDRTVISSSWLSYTIGRMFEYMLEAAERVLEHGISKYGVVEKIPYIGSVMLGRTITADEYVKSVERILDKLIGSYVEGTIESDMYIGENAYAQKFLYRYLEKRYGKNVVAISEGISLGMSPLEFKMMVEQYGYRLVILPRPFRGLVDFSRISEVMESIYKRATNIVPDKSLDDVQLRNLRTLRMLVEYLYGKYKDNVYALADRYNCDIGKIKPTVNACKFVEKNVLGTHDRETGSICIRPDMLRSRNKSLSVFIHELAHHITCVGDENQWELRKAIEEVAGLVISVLTKELMSRVIGE